MAALSFGHRTATGLIILGLAACTGVIDGERSEVTTGPAGGSVSAGSGPSLDPEAPTPPAPNNPGSVSVRRLNRVEYDNTVRDLLGTELRPAKDFPADDPGAGFDTVGAAASLSPTYVRDYEAAAHRLIDDLFADKARWAKIVSCDIELEGKPCAEAVLRAFSARAFRRPATNEEVQRLLTPLQVATEVGATQSDGLRHALAAVLLSPHFIFKLEMDADPQQAAPHRLTDYELATRLSYALWSTTPDAELLADAEASVLQQDAVLERQLTRMLADPRAQALAQNFAAQWLHFRELEVHEVEGNIFPKYTTELAVSMKREAELFFMDFLHSPKPLSELLTSRFTYVDQRLAGHYGLPTKAGAAASEMWLVDTANAPRIGLLTLGAVLTATSFSTRTSPVKRGEFVLTELLCASVPPPPPDVIGLAGDEGDTDTSGLTLRQRLEAHREKAECRSCHAAMDPLGFGLENYDAIGAYRTLDNGQPIDAEGELLDGTRFSGAIELAATLSADPRLGQCITSKFMTFALGRFLDQADDPTWIAHLAGSVRDSGGDFNTLVRTLVMSEAFRSRQGTTPAVPAP
jgi:hypothetical protein